MCTNHVADIRSSLLYQKQLGTDLIIKTMETSSMEIPRSIQDKELQDIFLGINVKDFDDLHTHTHMNTMCPYPCSLGEG